MTLLKSVLGQSCFGPKYIQAKVGIGPNYYLGWSIPRAKMCLWPKYALGQSECGAKLGVSPYNALGKSMQPSFYKRNIEMGHSFMFLAILLDRSIFSY